jgi:hypothetical protein
MSCSTTIPKMFESNLRRNPRQRHASWILFVILTVPPLWLSFLLIDEIVQLPFLLVFWSCFVIALLNVVYQQHQLEMNVANVVPLGTHSIGYVIGSPLLNKSGHISPLVNKSDNGRSSLPHDTSIPGILDLTTFGLNATDHHLRRDIGDEIF